jgi:hypothetical protein
MKLPLKVSGMVLKSAPEAKKHIEGSVSTDKELKHQHLKGEWDGIEICTRSD